MTGVVGLEILALLIGITSGRYASVGDRIEILSLNLDAKMGLILLAGAILVTLPDTLELQPAASRSRLATRTLYAITGLGGVIAVLALVGVGLDLSRDVTSFGTNQGAAVIHRLAILLMAVVTCGWSLAALGVRVITARR